MIGACSLGLPSPALPKLLASVFSRNPEFSEVLPAFVSVAASNRAANMTALEVNLKSLEYITNVLYLSTLIDGKTAM